MGPGNHQIEPEESPARDKRRYYTTCGEIHTGQALGRGSNGTVYAIKGEPENAVKIFRRAAGARRQDYLRRKLDAMSQAGPPQDTGVFIAWPKQSLQDEKGAPCGFTMLRLPEEQRSLHKLASQEIAEAERQLRRALQELHRQGIVIGDLHLKNIKADRTGNIALVDTDWWQLGTPDGTYNAEGITKAYARPSLRRAIAAGQPCYNPGCPLDGEPHCIRAACQARAPEDDLYALELIMAKLRRKAGSAD